MEGGGWWQKRTFFSSTNSEEATTPILFPICHGRKRKKEKKRSRSPVHMGKEGKGTVKKVESSLTLHRRRRRRRRRHRARRRWFHKKLFLPPSLFHTFFRWIKGGRIGREEAKKKSHQGKVSEEKSATTFFLLLPFSISAPKFSALQLFFGPLYYLQTLGPLLCLPPFPLHLVYANETMSLAFAARTNRVTKKDQFRPSTQKKCTRLPAGLRAEALPPPPVYDNCSFSPLISALARR